MKLILLLSMLSPVVFTGTFVTAPCNVDADCNSGCCGFTSGKCEGSVIAIQQRQGCGHGTPVANGNEAFALGFTSKFPVTNLTLLQEKGISITSTTVQATTTTQQTLVVQDVTVTITSFPTSTSGVKIKKEIIILVEEEC